MLAAQEAERVGIARDLHDEVGQALTGVLLQLGSIAVSTAQAEDELEQARDSVRSALDEVRRISRELRPEMLADLGLVSALTELTRTFGRAARVRVDTRLDHMLPRLAPETELALYRIAQESLTNVARHARASRVGVDLASDAASVVLVVRDDGAGFDGDRTGHGGLRGMRERAVLVGGALELREPDGGGVEVRVEVPARRNGDR